MKTALIVTAAVLGFLGLIGGAVVYPLVANTWWAYTAPTISRLQEKQQVYTAQNRIGQYNKFYDEYSAYQTNLQSVKNNENLLSQFKQEHSSSQIASDPTGNLTQLEGQYESGVTGAQTVCTQSANTFNNDSKKVETGAMFKGVDLSQEVDAQACNQ